MGDTSTILACKTDMNKPCHSHACPNLFVPRAETAALLINSCEQGNDMQMLNRLDFFTKQRKYLLYNMHCLHVLGYHSLSKAVILWKTITEGKFYEIYGHTQSWLVNNQIYGSASNSRKIRSISEILKGLCWENSNFWFTQSFHFETFNNNQEALRFNSEGSLSTEW